MRFSVRCSTLHVSRFAVHVSDLTADRSDRDPAPVPVQEAGPHLCRALHAEADAMAEAGLPHAEAQGLRSCLFPGRSAARSVALEHPAGAVPAQLETELPGHVAAAGPRARESVKAAQGLELEFWALHDTSAVAHDPWAAIAVTHGRYVAVPCPLWQAAVPEPAGRCLPFPPANAERCPGPVSGSQSREWAAE